MWFFGATYCFTQELSRKSTVDSQIDYLHWGIFDGRLFVAHVFISQTKLITEFKSLQKMENSGGMKVMMYYREDLFVATIYLMLETE